MLVKSPLRNEADYIESMDFILIFTINGHTPYMEQNEPHANFQQVLLNSELMGLNPWGETHTALALQRNSTIQKVRRKI